jgi:predicted ferric reductase
MKNSLLIALVLGAGVAAGAFGGRIPIPGGIEDAVQGPHAAWYASRGAGIAAYLCIWASLAGGLLMSSAWFDGLVGRARLLAIHQTASIAGVALGLLHGLILIPDGWTHFGLSDILIPGASYYKTSLSALGTLTLYLSAVVSASFWLRPMIGVRMWRLMHYSSAVVYAAALWHGLKLGTDSREAWGMSMYLGTSLAIVAFLVTRFTYARPARQPAKPREVSTAV